MKKCILFFLAMILATTMSFSQNLWKGFWKPVTSDAVFMSSLRSDIGTYDWKFRPTFNVIATKLTLTGDAKVFNVGTLNAAGVGISIQHFIDVDGVPYNNFGVNAMLMLNTDINTEVDIAPSPFIGVQALQYFNGGVGYDTGLKKIFFALGISYSFNK